MINLNQSIANVKEDIGKTPAVEVTREFFIEAIMHEGAGRDRKTLLDWLNAQVDAFEVKLGYAPVKPLGEGVVDLTPDAPRATPVYRPEKRGNVWCVLDAANERMRQETFENKGDASAFIVRLEQDVGGLIEEKLVHYLRSE